MSKLTKEQKLLVAKDECLRRVKEINEELGIDEVIMPGKFYELLMTNFDEKQDLFIRQTQAL